jgi:mono/diheme cytochrome c family protein
LHCERGVNKNGCMKTFLRILGGLVLLIVVAASGFYAYVSLTWERDYSSTPLPNIHASTAPDVIARGEYVANVIGHCSGCHQQLHGTMTKASVDFTKPLSGGLVFDVPMFGKFVSANLTPDKATGIGALSDGLVARAIRTGVGRHGKILPFMLFVVGPMSDDDLTAVVSWLRVQRAVTQKSEDEAWGFAAKALAGAFKPRMSAPPKHVPPGVEPSVERGRYLAQGPANCRGCHTPLDMMTLTFSGPDFSGNTDAEPDASQPGFEFVTPNLTPDPETGHITSWSEEAFFQRLHAGRVFAGSKMPWENFARMTDADVRSVYRYLRTVPPTRHVVGPTHRKVGGG